VPADPDYWSHLALVRSLVVASPSVEP
jgi:hypothetical protein